MDFSNYTDEQLLTRYGKLAADVEKAEAEVAPVRAELLRRQVADGVDKFAAGGWESQLVKQPVSLAWLKKLYGYDAADLPEGIIGEKVVPDLNPERLLEWLSSEDHKVEPSYTIRIKRTKA